MAAIKLYLFCFFPFLEFSVLPCQILTGDNICSEINSTTMFCCKDYHQVGNVCVECDPGFYGDNCSLTCPTNYYGLRCSNKCHCSSEKYCDHVRGCLCKQSSFNCTDEGDTEHAISDLFISKCNQCKYFTIGFVKD
ncbi:uncharacterized protein LOC144627777 [Crassostrea virginica]